MTTTPDPLALAEEVLATHISVPANDPWCEDCAGRPFPCLPVRLARAVKEQAAKHMGDLAESYRQGHEAGSAKLAAAEADTKRLDRLEEWLRWRPGSGRELWTGASGFSCCEQPPAPVDHVNFRLRAAIDEIG